MSELNLDKMALAPGVVETIVSIAANEVEGVAAVGSSPASNLRSVFGARPSVQGIEIVADEDNKLVISLRIEVFYGYALPELADRLRAAIADAVLTQVGLEVSAVDVFIDGIQFSR